MLNYAIVLRMFCMAIGFLVFNFKLAPLICTFFAPVYAKMEKKKQDLQNTRITAIVFSASCSLTAIYLICTDDNLQNDFVRGYSWQAEAFISVCLAFFIADLYLLRFSVFDPFLTYVHHILGLFIYSLVMMNEACAFFGIFRFMSEISTPFLLIRGVWKDFDLCSKRTRQISDIIGVVLFTITRILAIPYYNYHVYQMVYTESFQRLNFLMKSGFFGCGFVVDAMNLFWFYKILQVILGSSKPKNTKS